MTRAIVLLLLAIIFAGAIFWRYADRKKQKTTTATNLSPALADRYLPAAPVPFGYKTGWFAVRSTDMNAVAKALQLQECQTANWQYGIWHAVESDDYQIFVSPPVDGWILAVGTPILFEGDNHATQRMIELSRQFGEVHFFANMRVSDVYTWARAKDGNLVRRYYEGEGARSETGSLTEAEREMHRKLFDASSPEAKDPNYWKRKDLVFLDEDYVLQIAGKWSVNPAKLDQMGLQPALGILGSPSESYPAKLRRHN